MNDEPTNVPDSESPAPSSESSAAMPDDSAPSTTPEPAKKKSRVWIWIAVAVVVLLLVGGGAYAVVVSQSSSGSAGLLFFLRPAAVTVPSVVGLSQQDAQTALINAGLRLGKTSDSPTLAVAPGIVVSQTPAPTATVDKDSAVDVGVSSIPQVAVPDVTGETQSNAQAALANVGLQTGPISYVFDSNVKAGYVKSQQPDAGTEATIGAIVDLTVSKGTQTGQVPNVVGLSQGDAESTIEGAAFTAKAVKATSTSVPAGDVISESPAAGTVVAAGSTVTITVSTGPPAAPQSSGAPAAAPQATVPNVIGMGVISAVNELQAAELKFSIGFAASAGNFLKVTAQNPGAGKKVDPGSTVKLTIGLPDFTLGGGGRPSGGTTGTPEPTAAPTPEPTALPAPQPSPLPAPTPTPSPQPQPTKPTTTPGS